MNYARAVKGPYLDSDIFIGIQHQAELEIRRFLTADEIARMTRKHSLQQLFQNIGKVVFKV